MQDLIKERGAVQLSTHKLEDDNLVSLHEPSAEHEKGSWPPLRYAEKA